MMCQFGNEVVGVDDASVYQKSRSLAQVLHERLDSALFKVVKDLVDLTRASSCQCVSLEQNQVD